MSNPGSQPQVEFSTNPALLSDVLSNPRTMKWVYFIDKEEPLGFLSWALPVTKLAKWQNAVTQLISRWSGQTKLYHPTESWKWESLSGLSAASGCDVGFLEGGGSCPLFETHQKSHWEQEWSIYSVCILYPSVRLTYLWMHMYSMYIIYTETWIYVYINTNSNISLRFLIIT